MKKIIILGASRGLGWSLYQKLPLDFRCLLISRKINSQKNLLREGDGCEVHDLAQTIVSKNLIQQMIEFDPDYIVYSAGGGPYGIYQSKDWKDHEWAYNLNFKTPAFLLYELLQRPQHNLKAFVAIGSAIAESSPDPRAASYCAAKHALRGLVSTLQEEHKIQQNGFQIKLFSPGYMATDMLPKNSSPIVESRAESPDLVAERLLKFILSSESNMS